MISIIIPVYNEGKNVQPLYTRLSKSIEHEPQDFEIIFVDDGSHDETLAKIDKLSEEDHRVKYIALSRNFGQQAALKAGFDFSHGDAVICLDGDLQHPPELIPTLIEEWKNGYDIVSMVRSSTIDIPILKKLSASAFYWTINKLSVVRIDPYASDFRLIDRKVVNAITAVTERRPFYRGMVKWVGFKQKLVPYVAESRRHGETSYAFGNMIMFAVNGLLSYSYIPVAMIVFFSVCVTLLAIVYLAFILYSKFVVGNILPGQTGIILSILLIGMAQMLSSSVIAIYVYKTFQESRGLPAYILLRSKGFDD